MKARNLKRFFLTSGILMTTITFWLPARVINAAEVVNEESVIVDNLSNADIGIEPQADVIYYRFRVNNGIRQKRRWNETKGCWVDPYWINID